MEAIAIAYYSARCPLFLERCDYGIQVFTEAVNKLTDLSNTHSELFFSPPLKCAKELLYMCQVIEKGLKSEKPNFIGLIQINVTFRDKQVKQFHEMARTANSLLSEFDGFCTRTLVKIFKKWVRIKEKGLMRTANNQPVHLDSRIIAHQNFMEVFDIKKIDIFHICANIIYEPREQDPIPILQQIDVSRDDDTDSQNSLSSSHTEASFEDDVYITVENGEYEEFEREWLGRILSGTDVPSDEEVEDEQVPDNQNREEETRREATEELHNSQNRERAASRGAAEELQNRQNRERAASRDATEELQNRQARERASRRVAIFANMLRRIRAAEEPLTRNSRQNQIDARPGN